ncbi:hypothetical protein HanRHA438_Chr11g0496431 [Helianthus annuus]|nr:hypothetical protein HanIR_Chr11g0520561 [Helianthus annuus]KAJ0870090.1 hypothetical protein HanRHA438_Chr11g0496431 [Helianthus annuus]
MTTDMYGRWIPDPNVDMYTSKGSCSVPSWAQSPTPPSSSTPSLVSLIAKISYKQKGSVPSSKIKLWDKSNVDCDSTVQLENNGQTRTAFYAEIVKNVSDGESSGNDDSSEHGSSSVEDVTSSSSSEDGSEYESTREVVDSEANESLSESESSQVCVDKPSSDRCNKCVSLGDKFSELQSKYDDLQSKYHVTFIHNQGLIVDLLKCNEANMFYENHEKEFKTVIENLRKDKTELTKMVSRKQTDINYYINRLKIMQKELACVKCESEAIRLKLDSYSNSRYVLDHIIDIHKEKKDVMCIGYKKCPPPVRQNYDAMPDGENRTYYEQSVPLYIEEFATGLGYKIEVSSDSDVSADTDVSTAEQNQDPPVIIEDADSSDDESDDTDSAQSDAVIKEEDKPLENHILCDPPAKPAKTVLVESTST